MAQAVIGALRVNLGLNSAQFSKGLKQSEGSLKRFGRMAAKGMFAAAAAVTAAAGGVALAVRGTLNEADKMSKVSRSIGIPIEELSKLKHAADLSGVSFDQLQAGVRRFSQNMNDAFNGVGEGKEAFEQLGISVKNADGSMKTSTQVMAEISDRFAEMPDGVEKTALALDLFGRNGAAMINMLNGGSAGLNSMMKEAEQLGIVFDKQTGENAERFNDNLTRLGTAFKSIAMQIAADLVPHLVKFTDWLVENAPRIRSEVVGAIEVMGNSFAWVSEKVGLVYGALTAFGEAGGEVGLKINAFAKSLPEFFAGLPARMMQIGSDIIAGLWSGLKSQWESVKEGVSGLASGVVDRFKSVLRIQSPSKVMAEIGAFIMEGLGQGLDSGASRVGNQLSGMAQTLQSSFSGWIDSAIDGTFRFKDALAGLARDLTRMLANRALQAIITGSFGGGTVGAPLNLLPSFAGGGATPRGPRTGGLDGKGGFPAILHPNETVIDHTRTNGMAGGGQSVVKISLGDGLEASILEKAAGQSLQIVRASEPGTLRKATAATQRSFHATPSKWRT